LITPEGAGTSYPIRLPRLSKIPLVALKLLGELLKLLGLLTQLFGLLSKLLGLLVQLFGELLKLITPCANVSVGNKKTITKSFFINTPLHTRYNSTADGTHGHLATHNQGLSGTGHGHLTIQETGNKQQTKT